MPLGYAEIVISYGKYHIFANYMTIHGRIRRQNFGDKFFAAIIVKSEISAGCKQKNSPAFYRLLPDFGEKYKHGIFYINV